MDRAKANISIAERAEIAARGSRAYFRSAGSYQVKMSGLEQPPLRRVGRQGSSSPFCTVVTTLTFGVIPAPPKRRGGAVPVAVVSPWRDDRQADSRGLGPGDWLVREA